MDTISTRFTFGRIVALVLGVAGFALLMGLRGTTAGAAPRALLAGLAFLWAAGVVVYIARAKPR